MENKVKASWRSFLKVEVQAVVKIASVAPSSSFNSQILSYKKNSSLMKNVWIRCSNTSQGIKRPTLQRIRSTTTTTWGHPLATTTTFWCSAGRRSRNPFWFSTRPGNSRMLIISKLGSSRETTPFSSWHPQITNSLRKRLTSSTRKTKYWRNR